VMLSCQNSYYIWVNRPLQVSQLGQLSLSSFRIEQQATMVAPSGECLRGEGLVWFIGAVMCSLAAAAGPIVR